MQEVCHSQRYHGQQDRGFQIAHKGQNLQTATAQLQGEYSEQDYDFIQPGFVNHPTSFHRKLALLS